MKKRGNGSDAVRGVGPLRMIRREVSRTAPAAGLCTGLVRTAGHLGEATEVEGNTVKLQLLSTNRPPPENCLHSTVPVCDGVLSRCIRQRRRRRVLGLSQGALAAA